MTCLSLAVFQGTSGANDATFHTLQRHATIRIITTESFLFSAAIRTLNFESTTGQVSQRELWWADSSCHHAREAQRLNIITLRAVIKQSNSSLDFNSSINYQETTTTTAFVQKTLHAKSPNQLGNSKPNIQNDIIRDKHVGV